MSDAPDKSCLLASALGQYQGPLVRYVTRITGDQDRAADVVQETFLRLWSAPAPPASGALAQWLFTVARNLALDVLRKERRMNALTEERLAGAAAPCDAPDQAAQRDENLAQALAAMTHLSPNQQEVVRLKFQNQFSYKQIAGITGLSVTNVGFLLHTAIKKIRQHLAADRPAAASPGAAP